ncbi:ArnT family glycosyltransferase [Halioxenophilus sp. WMMB6]|uniref:ArnT family glycosyltransferase n=1 Tax=Halioxenophilus sp. WMMB6 TaxID=3073815 RepID=UPI00295EE0CB|nr:glycosyltransferase family 39 protein [Halioxenophilus sp. WMMB6]
MTELDNTPHTPASVWQSVGLSAVWRSPVVLFYSLLLLAFCYRCYLIWQPYVGLFYDEIYYYHWSLSPDLGYYSKPPMLAWLIGAFTSIAGDSKEVIKFSALCAWTLTSWVVYRIGSDFGGRHSGAAAGLLFSSMPLVGFYSLFITTDSVLLLFWSLSLWQLLWAFKTGALYRWALVGLFAGCGMLSKYNFAVFPLTVFIYLLLNRERRPILSQAGPWLAVLISAALFSLNVYWNYQNHWVSWQHTAEISQLSGNLIHPLKLLEFLVSQLFLLGLVSAYLLWRNWRMVASLIHQQEWARVVLWPGVGLLTLIAVQALFSRAFANWAAPALISAVLLLGAVLRERPKSLMVAVVCNWLLLAIFYHYPVLLKQAGVESTTKNNPYERVLGWDELGNRLQHYKADYPAAVLASDSRKLLAYFGYYLYPGSNNFAYWNEDAGHIQDYYDLKNNFSYWQNNDRQEFLFLTNSPVAAPFIERFMDVQLLETIQDYHVTSGKLLYIYWLRGFHGYGEMVPKQ